MSSPLLDEPNAPNVPFARRMFQKKFSKISGFLPVPRQRQIRRDLSQRNHDKGPFAQARMWHGQPRERDLISTVQQQVHVYNARPPAFGSHPAHLIFNVQQSIEQRLRRKARPGSGNHVQEIRLFRDADRRGLIQ